MSVRAKIKSLTFCDGEAEWWGDFNQVLDGWNAKFRLELHGDDTIYGGTVAADPQEFDVRLDWDNAPPGDRQFLASLERFVGTAFRMSVYIHLAIEPVNLDEVEEEEEEEVA